MQKVLEHVSDISLMMHDLCQLVRRSPEEASHVPGAGALYITTINRTNLSYGLGIMAAENLMGLVPPGTHEWHKFVKPEELRTHLDHNHFDMHRTTGAFYNPLLDRWDGFPDTSVNYLVFSSPKTAT